MYNDSTDALAENLGGALEDLDEDQLIDARLSIAQEPPEVDLRFSEGQQQQEYFNSRGRKRGQTSDTDSDIDSDEANDQVATLIEP
jgi:hypothetical protein